MVYAIAGFVFGVYSFFWGFKRLRRKRLIENIPTSTIRGLAIGLVELYGKAEPTTLLKSPLTNTDCVLFKYLIEEYRKSGKSGHWVKIASGDSFACPFYLNDETGKIMVYPYKAELILPADYKFETGFGRAIPDTIVEFMENTGIRYKSWLGYRRLRFTEWFIEPKEYVYVLGTAKKLDTSIDYKNALKKRIEELKKNPEKMKEIDLNKDGEISTEEWDLAVSKLEQELLEKILQNTTLEEHSDVIIGKGDVEKIFIISDRSEKELVKKLLIQSLLGIYGGIILSLFSLWWILMELGINFR